METLLSLGPWILVKIKLENPEKWQNSAENDPENPENGVKKWLDTHQLRPASGKGSIFGRLNFWSRAYLGWIFTVCLTDIEQELATN